MNIALKRIQEAINLFKKNNPNESVGELSDTYHSFNDLYKHRTVLTAALFMYLPYAWKSMKHEDGTMFDGMFIVGAPTPDGMITYHYDMEYWNLFKVPVLPHAPHFDGHTPEDVVSRLSNFVSSSTRHLVNDGNIENIEKIVNNEILPTFGDDLISKAGFISFFNGGI